ncbi:hypothetical protein V8G54_005682, partial [Vigna mungo]
ENTQLVALLRPWISPNSLQYPPGYVGAVPHRSQSDSGGEGVMNSLSYLTNILTSKVYDVAVEPPLQLAPKLSEKFGVKVWPKREDLQPGSSHHLCFIWLISIFEFNVQWVFKCFITYLILLKKSYSFNFRTHWISSVFY